MKQISSILLFLLAIIFNADAQTDKRIKEFNLNKSQLAVQGYDPVAYFKQGKAAKGINTHALVYNGVRYHFISAENKENFKAAPSKYEPQYGGWCAYAMGATGEKVEVDPETFKILNGKLYLFYNSFLNNTLKSWNKDEQNLHSKADTNWEKYF